MKRRKLLTEALNACDEWGLILDAVNTNDHHKQKLYGYDSRKIGSCFYIDDKLIGCQPWSVEFVQQLLHHIETANAAGRFETYAVDFDGTICEESYPEIGTPNKSLINTLNYARYCGHQIVLWTCREDPPTWRNWPRGAMVASIAVAKYLFGLPFRCIFYGILFLAAVFGTSSIVYPAFNYLKENGKRG